MSKRSPYAPRIALATHMGGYAHARVCDMVLADALHARGADPEFILCDGALPACQMTKLSRIAPQDLVSNGQEAYCSKCFSNGVTELGPRKHPVQMVTSFLSAADKALAHGLALEVPVDAIRSFVWESLPIGEHAYAGALRYLARGDFVGEALAEPVQRKYLQSAMLIALSTRKAIATRGYEIMVAHHGIYTPQGVAAAVARSMGVRLVTYNPAYRRHSFIFSHGDTYHHTMVTEPVSAWRGLELTPRVRSDLDQYLMSRRSGANDWIWFHNEPIEDHAAALRSVGADPDKPYAALLTSVVWDAQLHYEASAFPSMIEWLVETVRLWSARTDDLQLVVRVHPAELRGAVPSRQRAADELRRVFGEIPKGVFIIPPANEASTYALCDHANAVIVYNTKTGVEAAAAGRKVIVAGEAWVRGKGFTIDVSDPAHYRETLASLPFSDDALSTDTHELALKYAYHFFFRRMIPLPFVMDDGAAKFWIDGARAKDLRPGAWPGLDVICDGILGGSPFIYPAERMSAPFGHENADAA